MKRNGIDLFVVECLPMGATMWRPVTTFKFRSACERAVLRANRECGAFMFRMRLVRGCE